MASQKELMFFFVNFTSWCCLPLCAANVLWNCFSISERVTGVTAISYYDQFDHRIWPEICLSSSLSGQNVVLTVNHEHTVVAFTGNWVAAQYGDIACEATTRHLDAYLYHEMLDNSYQDDMINIVGTDDGPRYSAGQTMVARNTNLYLMFAVASDFIMSAYDSDEWSWERDADIYYGWIQLWIDGQGDLSLINSAIELDRLPITVGGGSTIPEPHSGLLLLAGGALLALRRRRRCNTGFQFLDRARSEQVR